MINSEVTEFPDRIKLVKVIVNPSGKYLLCPAIFTDTVPKVSQWLRVG